MKTIRFLLLVFAVVGAFSVATDAQTKKRPAKSTPASNKTSTLPPLDVRAARSKVDVQLTNVSLFVKNFGPVAQAIEALDAEAKTNKRIRKESIDKNNSDKKKVVDAIRGLRDGMVKLESEFRVKPALKKYLPLIQGISDLAGQSEASAIAGQFVSANASLKSVQQKLTDTLAAMPAVEI